MVFVVIMGLVDIIAAILLAMYASHLGQWVWIIIAILVYKGLMSLLGIFMGR